MKTENEIRLMLKAAEECMKDFNNPAQKYFLQARIDMLKWVLNED
jgi:hypothetical protein